jgi:iron complex transport system substrate-binding protein
MTKRLIALAAICLAPLLAEQVRVVSLSSPLAETMYSLGARNSLVGVSDVCLFPDQIVADRKSGKIRVVGSFTKPDLNEIDALHPTLILTSTSFQTALAEVLRKRGYTVLHFEPHSLSDIFDEINQIGQAVGKRAEALHLTAQMRQQVDEISKKSKTLPRVKLYLEINHEGPWTVSPLENLIEAAGGENIFADRHTGPFITTNQEIIRRNPDVILSPIWLGAKSRWIRRHYPARPHLHAARIFGHSRRREQPCALL